MHTNFARWKTYQASNSLSAFLNSLLPGLHMKPINHIFYDGFLLRRHLKACLQASTMRFLNGIVNRSRPGCVFLCCLLISLLRWPDCYVLTEGGWLAGPEAAIWSEFTDFLTRDIRGASFSHARWSPGSDSTKASGLQGNLTGPEKLANTCHPLTLQAQ